jgi:hypothetical protein
VADLDDVGRVGDVEDAQPVLVAREVRAIADDAHVDADALGPRRVVVLAEQRQARRRRLGEPLDLLAGDLPEEATAVVAERVLAGDLPARAGAQIERAGVGGIDLAVQEQIVGGRQRAGRVAAAEHAGELPRRQHVEAHRGGRGEALEVDLQVVDALRIEPGQAAGDAAGAIEVGRIVVHAGRARRVDRRRRVGHDGHAVAATAGRRAEDQGQDSLGHRAPTVRSAPPPTSVPRLTGARRL